MKDISVSDVWLWIYSTNKIIVILYCDITKESPVFCQSIKGKTIPRIITKLEKLVIDI